MGFEKAYEKFLDQNRDLIDSEAFLDEAFHAFWGSDIWAKFIDDLLKLGVDPLKCCLRIIPSNFFARTKITNLILPEGIKKIGRGAFSNCMFLEKVVLPSSLECIDKRAFAGDTSLNHIIYNGSMENWIKVKKVGEEIFMGSPCKAIEFSKPSYFDKGVAYGKYNDVSGNTSSTIGKFNTDKWDRIAEYSKQWAKQWEEDAKLLKEIKDKWSF